MPKKKTSEKDKDQELQKIAAIREMIASAERTIASARAMLSQIEGVPVKNRPPSSRLLPMKKAKLWKEFLTDKS